MKRSRIGSIRNTRKAQKVLAAASLSAAVVSTIAPASAATKTWLGNTADPSAAAYTASAQGTFIGLTNGPALYPWNTTVPNWTAGGVSTTYAVGDDTVFT